MDGPGRTDMKVQLVDLGSGVTFLEGVVTTHSESGLIGIPQIGVVVEGDYKPIAYFENLEYSNSTAEWIAQNKVEAMLNDQPASIGKYLLAGAIGAALAFGGVFAWRKVNAKRQQKEAKHTCGP